MKVRSVVAIFFVVFCLCGITQVSHGMPILPGGTSDYWTWTASDSEGRSASADFYFADGKFNILLENTAGATTVPNTVLAGLFFDLVDGFSISNPHVEVAVGSTLQGLVTGGAGYNMDGEFGYLAGIDGINGGLGDYGIAATGFDPEDGAPVDWDGFGADTIINTDYSFPSPSASSPNGAEAGLVGGNIDNLVTASIASYVQSAVLIQFDFEWPGEIPDSVVSQVNFLYGTDYAGTPVPEPKTMLLLGVGLLSMVAVRKKTVKK
ncbi:MAG: PEP-CTERM sorting domain-containing protein [Deltaproteobacteria bacterium]|nr:PEP-CTERM sorting domain-containing protein [Candidatus Anaeroferrophillus wilburensis]MBN2888756.1 PEP-CTERM sorting domain-containing protein [Deltaproteobacteria bacterium]